MKKMILFLTLSIASITASAGIFDNIGKDLSLAFGQCSMEKKARVELVLNNKDLTKPTIISDGKRPFKLYTKYNKKGLLILCEKDAKYLSINQVLSGTRSAFYCGNKVETCNVITISTSGGGGDDEDDNIIAPPPPSDDDDDVTPPPTDDDDVTPPPTDDDDVTPPTDDQTPPDEDTPTPVEDL